MTALSVELSTEQMRELAEVAVRAGLPPVNAPGFEPLADAIARFAGREITFGDFIAEVDRIDPFLELGLLQRLEREPGDGVELSEVRAGLRWLQRFPWREPAWQP